MIMTKFLYTAKSTLAHLEPICKVHRFAHRDLHKMTHMSAHREIQKRS